MLDFLKLSKLKLEFDKKEAIISKTKELNKTRRKKIQKKTIRKSNPQTLTIQVCKSIEHIKKKIMKEKEINKNTLVDALGHLTKNLHKIQAGKTKL